MLSGGNVPCHSCGTPLSVLDRGNRYIVAQRLDRARSFYKGSIYNEDGIVERHYEPVRIPFKEELIHEQ